MTFKFDPQAFNYEKAVQKSEAELENTYWTFEAGKQTACHIVPISSTEIGVNVWQFTSPLVSDKLFSRSTLSMKCTPSHNWFMRDKMIELGYTHGVRNSNGELEYRQCPVKELIDLTGLAELVPEFNGKKGTIIAKEVGFYIIVPYATRSIPTDKNKNPVWEPVNVVQPYWVTGKDGKNTSPHLRPTILANFAKSKGQAANLNGTTYLLINRLGKDNDTAYSGDVAEIKDGFTRPTAKQVLEVVSEKFESLNPVNALSFMMPSKQEVEMLAQKNNVVLKSLLPASNDFEHETVSSTTVSSTPVEVTGDSSVLDL